MKFYRRSEAHRGDKVRPIDIDTAIAESCDRTGSYDGGAVEKARDVADTVARKFGVLVQMLHERGLLTDDNVVSLVDHYDLERLSSDTEQALEAAEAEQQKPKGKRK